MALMLFGGRPAKDNKPDFGKRLLLCQERVKLESRGLRVQPSYSFTHWHAWTCRAALARVFNPFYLSLREWPRLPFTARIELHRCSLQARSFFLGMGAD